MMEQRKIASEIKSTVIGAAHKIEDLHMKIKSSIFGKEESTISGLTLVQTIQKIVDDNERLKEENNIKTAAIDELRVKESELLDRHKELIETHNKMMEDRNESLTETS